MRRATSPTGSRQMYVENIEGADEEASDPSLDLDRFEVIANA